MSSWLDRISNIWLKSSRIVPADTPTSRLILYGLVQGIIAGVLFGLLWHEGPARDAFFGAFMAAFWIGYSLYLRKRAQDRAAVGR